MDTATKQKKKPDRAALIYSGIAAAVSLAVIIIAVLVGSRSLLAWFAAARDVDADSRGLDVRNSYDLIIRRTPGGADIATTNPETRLAFSTFPATGLMKPGLSGTFDAYVVYGKDQLNAAYIMNVAAGAVENTAGENSGYRKDTQPEQQALALQLARTHLALFLHYENGVYSEWIAPDQAQPVSCTETADAEEQHITLYWMWLETYDELLSEDSTLIAAADRTRILQDIEAHPAAWFLDETVTTRLGKSNSYNDADAFLATVLESVLFKVDFSIS